MHFFEALLLGVVEGITEFLPISSTGHLILVSHLLGLSSTEFLKSFEIIIQLGAILAVFVLYGKRLLTSWETIKRVVVAFIPTAVLGFLAYPYIKQFLGSESTVLWALAIGGVALILFERWHKEDTSQPEDALISYRSAFLIGLFQSVAFIPGVSRAAATIIGGLVLGLRRKAAVEFSFLLAIPTMAAATGFDLIKNASAFDVSQFGLLAVGFIAAFVVALFAIKWLLRVIQTRTFIPFGVYRIVVALLFFSVIL